MVFSFAKKGNTHPWRGTWGSPFGMLRPKTAERLGDGQGPSVAVEPKFNLYKAGNDCDASKLDFRRTDIPSEGCADAMSADSSLSLTAALMRFKAMDSGDILLQDMTAIHPDETAVTLRDRLAVQGAELVLRALELLARGQVQWHPQDAAQATPAPKLGKGDGLLRWNGPVQQSLNRVRGLQPWPGAYTNWQGKRLKIFGAQRVPGEPGAAPGTIVDITTAGIVVAGRDGRLVITQLQPEGGRLMSASEFCRGHDISIGDGLQ